MKFYGELLIFVLLFVTNIRVFFVDRAKKDSLAALAPITFILSILQIAAWGVGLFTFLGFIISFLVLLSNFHAMFRYSENLYVDHYSPLMMVWAIFTSILSVAAIVLLFLFKPVEISNKKIGVNETLIKYSGDFKTGFNEANEFQKVTGRLYEYTLKEEVELLHKDTTYEEVASSKKSEPQISTTAVLENGKGIKGNQVVLFVPDKRGDTYYYEPFLQLLAKEGYTVVSADFYSKDCKWFHSLLDLHILRRIGMITSSLIDNAKFTSQREFFTYNITLEIKNIISMLKERYGKDVKIFIVSDGMSDTAASDIVKINKTNVTGSFALDSIPEYMTSGYGCIAQTSPFLNMSLGFPKEKNNETPLLLVEKVKEHITFDLPSDTNK